MVNDDVACAIARKRDAVAVAGTGAERMVAGPRAYVADDDVVGVDDQHAPAQADAVAGCSLACDGDEGLAHADRALDDAADAEHDDTRPFGVARGL